MNYISKLQEENRIMKEGLEFIRSYLSSSKFHGELNNYVNPQDILLRIEEINTAVFNVLTVQVPLTRQN